jgi:hypothetical protein
MRMPCFRCRLWALTVGVAVAAVASAVAARWPRPEDDPYVRICGPPILDPVPGDLTTPVPVPMAESMLARPRLEDRRGYVGRIDIFPVPPPSRSEFLDPYDPDRVFAPK